MRKALTKGEKKLEQLLAMAKDEGQEQKGGHPRGTEREKDSSCCHADGHGVAAQVPKVLRTSCTPGRQGDRRLWLLRCIYGTRFVSVTTE